MDEEKEEMEYLLVDERYIASLKAGMVGYGMILLLFVIAPTILTIFTSKEFTWFNVVIGLLGTAIFCIQQIKERFTILSSFEYITEDDEDLED